MLSLWFGIDCYHRVTSLCWLITQSSKSSQNSQEELCLSLSLASIVHFEIFWTWNFLRPWCYMKRGSLWKGRQSDASRMKRKNAVSLFRVLAHAWTQKLFDPLTLSDVRKTSPSLLKLIGIVFPSSAMARVLTITTLSFDWLMWQSRIIFFFFCILNDPSHRKQDSGIAK